MTLFVLYSAPPLEQLVVVSFLRLRRLPRRLLEKGIGQKKIISLFYNVFHKRVAHQEDILKSLETFS